MENEVAILKAAIANLVDERFGSVNGWTIEREVAMISIALDVSPAMAEVILQACDETYRNNAFDII